VPTTEHVTVSAATPAADPAATPATDLATRLAGCRDAEDYFRLLGVDHDPAVLAVNRLHILRAFGRELDRITDVEPGDVPATAERDRAREAALREALERSYATFTRSTALDHRLFQVLRDRAPGSFVPLDAVLPDPPPGPGHDPGPTAKLTGGRR
jgi:nitrogenase-stabilizing/protective protein